LVKPEVSTSGFLFFSKKRKIGMMPIDYRVERSNGNVPLSAMLRLQLTNEGYDVFQWCDNPGMVYGSHKHSEDQSHWVISGTLEITVERVGTFELKAGDRDYLPAEAYHSARVIGNEPVMYLVGIKK
jgi:quercetin dioxygenase-like cupin family protein